MANAGPCPVACLHNLLDELCRHLDEQRDAVQRVLDEIKDVLDEVDTAMVSCGQGDSRLESALRDVRLMDGRDRIRETVAALTTAPIRRAG